MEATVTPIGQAASTDGRAVDTQVEIIRRIVRQEIRAAVTEAEDAMRLREILNLLHDLPAAIRQQQETVTNLRRQLDDARTELETAEALLMVTITEAVDPKSGKPAYPNDTARKAELAKRRQFDPAYVQAASRVRELESALASAQADLDLLINRFTAARKLAELTAARLNLLAA